MKTDYDVLIIGSGASGGMAAHTLTKLGVSCLMLDAGPLLDFERDKTLKRVYDLPYRGFGKPGRFPHVTQASEFDANLGPMKSRTLIPMIRKTPTIGCGSG